MVPEAESIDVAVRPQPVAPVGPEVEAHQLAGVAGVDRSDGLVERSATRAAPFPVSCLDTVRDRAPLRRRCDNPSQRRIRCTGGWSPGWRRSKSPQAGRDVRGLLRDRSSTNPSNPPGIHTMSGSVAACVRAISTPSCEPVIHPSWGLRRRNTRQRPDVDAPSIRACSPKPRREAPHPFRLRTGPSRPPVRPACRRGGPQGRYFQLDRPPG